VIHRDIKPENILFSRTGAKIADFGIARIPDSTITRVNTVLGTPAYTSPEALSKADFGPGSDQFAFAATLYEAATGVRAFGGEDPIATAGKVSSEPPPPLESAIGTPAVVRSLNAALAKGVAKDVNDRFASCVDLGEAVARAIERPTGEGVGSLDALLAASGASHLDDNGGASDRIEIERTPLSSRAVAVRRTSDRPMLTPYGGETPARPSIIIRKQTHRLQNVIAAAALVVIVALVVMGKKQQQNEGASLQDAAKGLPSGAGAGAARATSTVVATPVGLSSKRAGAKAHNGDAGAEGGAADASADGSAN
jgi:serine/threonine-protein kinase